MTVIDNFFTNPPKIDNFHPRKLQLPKDKSFLLTGARGSGKSALVIDYINELRHNFLYIDCQDPAFILEDIESSQIEETIEEEQIKTLVLDHYFEGFLDELPKVSQLIVVSREELDLGLPSHKLYPLDFEEFMNFKKTTNPQSAFNLYAKYGSLPRIAKAYNQTLAPRELFFEKFDEQEGKVLLILALFQGKVATSHQIYQKAKDYFKISKDWLYKAIKNFENEGLLYQIPTLEKGFGKKVIIYDFLFSKYLNKNQPFITTFDTLVALALIKHKVEIKATNTPTSYLLKGGKLIQLSAFDNESQAWQKAHANFGFYTNLNIKDVTIITLSTSYTFKIKDITFSALPFYKWVTGL